MTANRPGRNEPCPCGSGKKYKRCCMLKELESASTDLLWRNTRSARDSVHQKVQRYSRDYCAKDDFLAAWKEWCLEFDEPIEASEGELSLFMSWFLFNWTNHSQPKPRPPLSIMFLADRASLLSEPEFEYLRSIIAEPFTFYEVIEAKPNHGMQMRCILSGRKLYVNERSGSQGVHTGDIFYGRLGIIGDIAIFDAVSDILVPPLRKAAILDLRTYFKRIKRIKKDDLLKKEHVLAMEKAIRKVYREIRDSMLNPQMPQLMNTDGDPLSFNKVIFDIDDPEIVFEALCPLCLDETRETLLGDAERDNNGRIVKLEFPWLKKGNKKHAGIETTLMGRIAIEKHRLTVDVNSANRETAIKDIVSKLCGNSARYKATLIEPYEAKLAEQEGRRTPEMRRKDEEEQRELMNHPEVKAKLREMQRKHMESWVTIRIPALGNKTPMQAMKTIEGRETVMALLTQFERDAGATGDREFDLELIQGIKKKLGLLDQGAS